MGDKKMPGQKDTGFAYGEGGSPIPRPDSAGDAYAAPKKEILRGPLYYEQNLKKFAKQRARIKLYQDRIPAEGKGRQ